MNSLTPYACIGRPTPRRKYWLLTNFPNWGWRGDVSYHARGPQRQDYGDYDQVVRTVLQKLNAAGIPTRRRDGGQPLRLPGGRASFGQPGRIRKSVDWLGRVRAYEDFARAAGAHVQSDRQFGTRRSAVR